MTPFRLTSLTLSLVGVTALVAGLQVSRARAAESAPVARELAEKFKQTRQEITETDLKKRRILGSLYTITQRMKKITHEKNNLTDELFHVQDNVKNIAKLIATLEVQIERQRHQLKRRLRALYKLSGEGYIGILFSQSSALDIDEALRNLKIVTENDYDLIRNYQDNIALYKNQRQKLKGQVERLVSIERRIKKQERMLVSEHKQKSKIVSELDHDRNKRIRDMKKLRAKTQSLAARAQADAEDRAWADLLKPSIFEQKGQLPSPVQGMVVRDFGLITNDKYKIQLSHKGWRYSAPKGTPVTSIFDGTVVHSSWINGYGQTVIVDHGDHYYSVYSYISRVKVKTGDTLKKGQVIAEAGPASRRHGEGLYFEIRHFSEPENPAQWIAARGIQISAPRDNEQTNEKADFARASFEVPHPEDKQ